VVEYEWKSLIKVRVVFGARRFAVLFSSTHPNNTTITTSHTFRAARAVLSRGKV